jgi:hypothetical protein
MGGKMPDFFLLMAVYILILVLILLRKKPSIIPITGTPVAEGDWIRIDLEMPVEVKKGDQLIYEYDPTRIYSQKISESGFVDGIQFYLKRA